MLFNVGLAISLLTVGAMAQGNAYDWSHPEHDPRRYMTPDGYWHNRYHCLLSMAAYGNYNRLCPRQTFTEEAKLRNFPNSERPPWTLLETWDTPSGCSGFSAIVPEMNKVLLVFRGNYEIERNLPTEVVPWSHIGIQGTCEDCTMNAFAAQGWLEAKNATNNFQRTIDAYTGAGLVFSITGHGLGGMHSQIAAADLNYQNICYYDHAYGSPRVFNRAGASWFNWRFNGEAGERGVSLNDNTSEIIPAGPDYTHAGTTFYYGPGYNATGGGQDMRVCWLDEDGPDNPDCLPGAQPSEYTSDQSHYFYMANVGQCGGNQWPDLNVINRYLANVTNRILNETAVTSAVPSTSSAMPSTSGVSTDPSLASAFPSVQVQAVSTSTSSAQRNSLFAGLAAAVLLAVGSLTI